MTGKFVKIDLSNHSGRIFVVGDIHGAFTKLEAALGGLGFNWDTDVLLSVGDLVDRGPESDQALEYLNRPNFYAVRGNHEQIVIDADGTGWHTSNGGKWFNKLKYTTRKVPSQAEFVVAFRQLPIAMEVLLPSGKKIGLVHACFPENDWDQIEHYVNGYDEEPMWDCYFLTSLKTKAFYGEEPVVANIDAIYHGHTPMKQPFSCGNRHYIDTGAVYDHSDDGRFTIVEVK